MTPVNLMTRDGRRLYALLCHLDACGNDNFRHHGVDYILGRVDAIVEGMVENGYLEEVQEVKEA